jgi:DNA modification methylase
VKRTKKASEPQRLILADESARKSKKQQPQKRRANGLDGKTWTKYSISVWSDIQKSKDERALGHPAMFPVELPRRLIHIFTNDKSMTVLDPFTGVGSTLVAAEQLGINGVGLEISKKYCAITADRLRQAGLFDDRGPTCQVHNADARDLLQIVQSNSIDLVVTSPPYWDILIEKRTADYKPQRDYGDDVRDLGRIRNYGEFLDALAAIFANVFVAMRRGAYCCTVIMDLRKKDAFYPYHSDFAEAMQKVGFKYDDLIIWDRRQEYNSMRPLGYPYVFRVNKAHEYILIFKKP